MRQRKEQSKMLKYNSPEQVLEMISLDDQIFLINNHFNRSSMRQKYNAKINAWNDSQLTKSQTYQRNTSKFTTISNRPDRDIPKNRNTIDLYKASISFYSEEDEFRNFKKQQIFVARPRSSNSVMSHTESTDYTTKARTRREMLHKMKDNIRKTTSCDQQKDKSKQTLTINFLQTSSYPIFQSSMTTRKLIPCVGKISFLMRNQRRYKH